MSNEILPATPLATLKRIRVGRLDSLAGIRAELGRVYREARRGELPTDHATRLASVLDMIRRVLEVEVLEKRLTLLEERVESPVAPVGHQHRGRPNA